MFTMNWEEKFGWVGLRQFGNVQIESSLSLSPYRPFGFKFASPLLLTINPTALVHPELTNFYTCRASRAFLPGLGDFGIF